VRFNGAYLNKSLQQITDLQAKDMALLTSLTYGVSKKYDYLRAIIFAQQTDLKLKRSVETLLVLAFYQFLFLDKIPTYAIIDTTVELTKKLESIPASRFVNAFLHKAFAHKEQLKLDAATFDTTAVWLSVRYSTPLWLVKLLIAQYGESKTIFFLANVELPARQFVRVNKLKTNALDGLKDGDYVTRELPYCLEFVVGGHVKQAGFDTGLYTVQNISSQSVGYFMNPQPYDKILDMCAAPGGKTTHLAELTNDLADITALDVYAERVAQIKDNQQRLGIKGIRVEVADATNVQTGSQYDKILLDAPCSGLGTLAQKPEIRYHLKPENLDELIVLQRKLIDHAWTLLKAGGELTYSTCTINRNENERQVQYLLKQFPSAELLEERTLFDEMGTGYAGFYFAKIRKQKL